MVRSKMDKTKWMIDTKRCVFVLTRRFVPGRIKIYRGCSGDVLDKFPDQYFDWVYIDGNHLYEFAKLDLELSLKKTKINGFIMGDDYAEGGWWQGGVKKAVDEFIQQKQVRLVMTQGRQFILQK